MGHPYRHRWCQGCVDSETASETPVSRFLEGGPHCRGLVGWIASLCPCFARLRLHIRVQRGAACVVIVDLARVDRMDRCTPGIAAIGRVLLGMSVGGIPAVETLGSLVVALAATAAASASLSWPPFRSLLGSARPRYMQYRPCHLQQTR